jgi:predicted HAD superfamily Cof-like phosphohydrolase
MQLMTEELAEVCEALCDQNLENLLKELSDLQYTVDGTVISFGLDQVWERAFARVHESNMSKLDANGHPIISDSGRVVKGPNYSPAKLGDLL